MNRARNNLEITKKDLWYTEGRDDRTDVTEIEKASEVKRRMRQNKISGEIQEAERNSNNLQGKRTRYSGTPEKPDAKG